MRKLGHRLMLQGKGEVIDGQREQKQNLQRVRGKKLHGIRTYLK